MQEKVEVCEGESAILQTQKQSSKVKYKKKNALSPSPNFLKKINKQNFL